MIDFKTHVHENKVNTICQYLLKSSYNIKREDMPQIAAKDVPEFLQELQSKNILVQPISIPVNQLMLTQNEINVDKVMSLIDGQKYREMAPILVSKERFVMDGSHRFAAQFIDNPYSYIGIFWIDCPIHDLIEYAHGFEKSFKKNVHGETV